MGIRRLLVLMLLALTISTASAQPGKLSDSAYYDKVRGAWLGKCIGGALGMPIESWNYRDIEAKYPRIEGYLGYFLESTWKGWSGMLTGVSVPKDGRWHKLYVMAQVPACDTATLFAVPILGMSLEYSREPACLEVMDARLLRPASKLPFGGADWETAHACAWDPAGLAGDVACYVSTGTSCQSCLSLFISPSAQIRVHPR